MLDVNVGNDVAPPKRGAPNKAITARDIRRSRCDLSRGKIGVLEDTHCCHGGKDVKLADEQADNVPSSDPLGKTKVSNLDVGIAVLGQQQEVLGLCGAPPTLSGRT